MNLIPYGIINAAYGKKIKWGLLWKLIEMYTLIGLSSENIMVLLR